MCNHLHISAILPALFVVFSCNLPRFPYIEVVYEEGQNHLELHYLSTRSRLNKVLVGIVSEASPERNSIIFVCICCLFYFV